MRKTDQVAVCFFGDGASNRGPVHEVMNLAAVWNIDLRTLKPLNMQTVAESIKKTNRAVTVHEACLTGGFGAELAARIQEELFDYLKAPVKRVAARDIPIPFSPPLEDYVLPRVSDVVEAARAVVYRKIK
jgi:pyruvate dehydrogenase E1 component beta subunit